ncbi:MAG: (d)CMP kinase [Oscillospiraceae bacterium]|nr:(d)CMP kinase [Oscillospiraceae bacterium]
MAINIAIDGPSGAGKSTMARAAAKALGYVYVDTGALYRSVGVHVLRQGLDTANAADVVRALATAQVSLRYAGGEQKVFLGSEDVSEAIRRPEASMAASNVSAVPEVRAFLFDLQKDLARENDCVMDGRDIGTVVLPEADVKIFLTASAEERARRRFEELTEKGNEVDYETILAEIRQRDYNDSNRAIAPLKPAEDSVRVDTTGLSLEEATGLILDVILSKLTNGE